MILKVYPRVVSVQFAASNGAFRNEFRRKNITRYLVDANLAIVR